MWVCWCMPPRLLSDLAESLGSSEITGVYHAFVLIAPPTGRLSIAGYLDDRSRPLRNPQLVIVSVGPIVGEWRFDVIGVVPEWKWLVIRGDGVWGSLRVCILGGGPAGLEQLGWAANSLEAGCSGKGPRDPPRVTGRVSR